MKLEQFLKHLKEQTVSNEQYRRFIEAELKQLHVCAKDPLYAQRDEWRPWCYACDELLGKASLLIALTHDKALIQWTRDAVLWIIHRAPAEWIGAGIPQDTPPIGTLATAHASRGASYPLLFCPDIFSEKEKEDIQKALLEKGIFPIDRYLEPRISNPRRSRNNWCVIELCGAIFASLALGDLEKVRSYLPFFKLLHTDYNSDFYGETVGYWNYSATGFFSIYLICELFCPDLLAGTVDPQTVMRPFLWAYYHRQGRFLLQGFDRYAPRGLTFGDCNTIWEVKPEVLLYIAVYHEDPRVRAIAAELFHDPDTDPDDKKPTVLTLMLLPFLKEGSADPAFLPTSKLFGDGYLLYKDAWNDPSIQIAIKAGLSELPKVGAHHHPDELSLQLAKNGIVILDDPSRCNYKLHTQALSASASWHSVPSFRTESGEELLQTTPLPTLYRSEKYNRLKSAKISERAFFAVSEASDLYPDQITQMRRTFAGAEENLLVILDEYTATEPVLETATFVGNNRHDQMKITLIESGGILAREGVGVKLQPLHPTTPTLDFAALHDRYISAVNSPYHGREGSGYLLRLQSTHATASARNFYVIFADHEENLTSWRAERKENSVLIFKNETLCYTFDFTNGVQIWKDGKDLLS